MKSRRSLSTSGFTLVEILVAISVFAVVSALSYAGLARALQTKERLDAERAFWSQMSLAFVRMDQDFSEARARGARDGDGVTLPAFMANASAADQAGLEFTRSGTPGVSARGLQRVGYEVIDHTLWRVTWPSVDRAPGGTPERSALVTDVDAFHVLLHSRGGESSKLWPASNGGDELPKGLEMTISIPGRGAFTRAFFIHD